ncbi:hypothetical protein [Streptomyces sp. BH055]|uniref:hypothetical protein n=1 Tax=Streptomyces sp. BH055 TaxID=3401173 RepID=UPI003BB7BA11
MFRHDLLHHFGERLRNQGAQVREATTRRPDAGYTTETVVVTALLAILALTVVGIIVGKVLGKANGIDLG